MERRRLKRARLFSSDLDGTLAGDRAAEARFADAWSTLDPASRPLLVYNSGRLIKDMQDFLPQTRLPTADILIGGVGTMLFNSAAAEDGTHYTSALGAHFDTRMIEAVLSKAENIAIQPAQFQHAHKSSWTLPDAPENTIRDIEASLQRAGLKVRVVYSSARDLDILPLGTDKGAALVWLCTRRGIDLDEVVVAGDTGNDASMFGLEDVRGIVVANALPELRGLADGNPRIYVARQAMADGVLEGFGYWDIIAGQT